MSTVLPLVSVVIVNWNGKKFLERLLPKLEKQSYPKNKYEIVVVDNNSTTDNSVEFINANYPDIILIENDRNDGFAGGCNIGINKCKGEYIILLNNDTEPDRDWLISLVHSAVKHSAGAVVSKLMYLNKPGIINNAGSEIMANSTWPIKEIGANKKDEPAYNKEYEISAFCGASVLLSRKMLEDIGLFDELFFMYFEDGDLSWRGQKNNWKYYYCPLSVVYHEHSGSSIEHSEFFTRHVSRNRLMILAKHSSLKIFFQAYASFVKDFFIKPIYYGLKRQNRRHQLHTLILGVKIHISLLSRLPNSFMKRYGLLKEQKLVGTL